ncbi:MAG: FG-GAP repeat protein [Verrucomicrobiae bacterium]|nr:FG-GAP repeat protein [Verrucomicrobiae bacterium]
MIAPIWCLPLPVRALDPVVTKLLPRGGGDRSDQHFGDAVAMSDRFVLVGEPDGGSLEAGAVHVFHAATGRQLRTLEVGDGVPGDDFGASVAISGRYAVIGAPGEEGNKGAVYVFDVFQGRQLAKRMASDGATGFAFGGSVGLSGTMAVVGASGADTGRGAAYVFDVTDAASPMTRLVANARDVNDAFGVAVAISGQWVAVGALRDDDVEPDAGAVYVFDRVTGNQLRKFTDSGAVPSDLLGVVVALDGGTLLASSIGINTGLKGAVHIYDIVSGVETGTLFPEDPEANDQFGTSLAIEGNLALVGTPFKSNLSVPGVVYAFDVANRKQLAKWSAIDGVPTDLFGVRLALGGNRAVIGATADNVDGPASGSAYLVHRVSGPLAMPAVAASRDFAPGVIEGDYARFFEAFVNDDGEAAFRSTLVGPGARGGKNETLHHTLDPGMPLVLAAQKNMTDLGGGVVAARFGPFSINRAGSAVFQATLRGAGIGRTNNVAYFKVEAGAAPFRLFGPGDSLNSIGSDVVLQTIRDASQGRGGLEMAASVALQKGSGGVLPENDSGILFYPGGAGQGVAPIREGVDEPLDNRGGGTSPIGNLLGEFVPRVSLPADQFVHFSAALQGDPSTNFGVFRALFTHDIFVEARRGEVAGGLAGDPLFRSFFSETAIDAVPIIRATVVGPGVRGANNEALFTGNGFVQSFARKGDEPDPAGEPGVTYRRFLQFWPAGNGGVVFLAKLGGRGVSGRNDCALYLAQPNGQLLRLLREGDEVGDADAPKVGSLLRLAVDPASGHYAVVTTLVGGIRGANLALWTGHAGAGNHTDLQALRLPALQMRKGTAYQRITGETVVVKSFAFPHTADRGGAGGRGNGRVINGNGQMALCLEFTNRGKEVLVGVP